MGELLAAVAAWDVAVWLRQARLGYALVNTAHVLGIALLVGAIVPLDLRLLGLWPRVDRAALVAVLVPMAACGLALALVSGGLLFAVRAPSYAALPVFALKQGLVGLGVASALALHLRHGPALRSASPARLRWAASVSLLCWLGALACGRAIAFFAD